MYNNTTELTKNVMDRCDELVAYSKRLIIESAITADSIDEDGIKGLSLMFGLVNDCKKLALDYAEKMEQISEINKKLDKLLQRRES